MTGTLVGNNVPDRPFNGMPLVRRGELLSPAPPAKQLGTVRIELGGLPELKEALGQAAARIQDLEALAGRQHGKMDQTQGRITELEAENKKLRTENQTLKDTLEAWQAVVRVAREKDSTLPDPEAVPC